MTSSKKVITLVSAEGVSCTVNRDVICMSNVIKNILNDIDDESEPIPLPNIKTNVLNKIIEYCKHHYNNPPSQIPQPLKSAQLNEVVSEWDYEFVNVDKEFLFELILAENFLDIKPLLDLTCAKVASMIKGKTPEQIRREFDIVNDFTPEEEAKVCPHTHIYYLYLYITMRIMN
uniref:Sulfur metabolism negative regulator, putative n=1 Tax=Theileria annulata TaxID=5874 RepID=A0A3B0NDL2_THEAN